MLPILSNLFYRRKLLLDENTDKLQRNTSMTKRKEEAIISAREEIKAQTLREMQLKSEVKYVDKKLKLLWWLACGNHGSIQIDFYFYILSLCSKASQKCKTDNLAGNSGSNKIPLKYLYNCCRLSICFNFCLKGWTCSHCLSTNPSITLCCKRACRPTALWSEKTWDQSYAHRSDHWGDGGPAIWCA